MMRRFLAFFASYYGEVLIIENVGWTGRGFGIHIRVDVGAAMDLRYVRRMPRVGYHKSRRFFGRGLRH